MTGQGTPSVVSIAGEMTIWRAAELKQTLLAALEGAGPIEIDLSQVSEVDTAGIQLLLLSRIVATTRGVRWRLGGRSEAVTRVLALLRLDACFDEPARDEVT